MGGRWDPPGLARSPDGRSSVERVQAAHILMERGGMAAAATSLLRELERHFLSPHPSVEGRGSWHGG
jgi:hypothetical protein